MERAKSDVDSSHDLQALTLLYLMLTTVLSWTVRDLPSKSVYKSVIWYVSDHIEIMSIPNEALQKVGFTFSMLKPPQIDFVLSYWSCELINHRLAASARNWDSGSACTAADQCCQDSNLYQTTGYSSPRANLERGVDLATRHKSLRRCWQNVRSSSLQWPSYGKAISVCLRTPGLSIAHHWQVCLSSHCRDGQEAGYGDSWAQAGGTEPGEEATLSRNDAQEQSGAYWPDI